MINSHVHPSLVQALRVNAVNERQDPAAFEVVYNRHKGLVMKTAFALMGNIHDAEDVLQEVFINVYRSAGKFAGGETEFKAWLRRITINKCLSNHRHKRTSRSFDQLRDEGFEPPEDESSLQPEAKCMAEEERQDIQRMLQCLDRRHYLAMVLRYYLELSYEEIAEALQIPVGTVRSRLHNAIGILRREFRAREETDREVRS